MFDELEHYCAKKWEIAGMISAVILYNVLCAVIYLSGAINFWIFVFFLFLLDPLVLIVVDRNKIKGSFLKIKSVLRRTVARLLKKRVACILWLKWA